MFFFLNLIRERHRRHRVIREHGLILPARMRSWLAKYNESLNPKLKNDRQTSTGRLISLMQLCSGVSFDRIAEGLQYRNDLQIFLLK